MENGRGGWCGFELTPPRPGVNSRDRLSSTDRRESASQQVAPISGKAAWGSTGARFHGSLGAAIPKLFEFVGGSSWTLVSVADPLDRGCGWLIRLGWRGREEVSDVVAHPKGN